MKKLVWVVGTVVVASVLGAGTAWAADFRTGEDNPRVSGVVDDDLYVVGNNIAISGQVEGEVVAAGSKVTLSGTSAGSLLAFAERVEITGKVGGTARTAARLITLEGEVDGDLMAAGQTVELEPESAVDRDLLVGAQELLVSGTVGGDLKGGANEVTIAGTINGDVEIDTSRLTLEQNAVINGDLVYTSSSTAERAEGSRVAGRIVRRIPASPSSVDDVGSLLLGLLRTVAGAFVLGVVIILLLPGFLPETTAALRGAMWLGSLGIGLAALFVIPALAIFLLVVTSLLGAGFSVPLLLIVLYAFLLILSKAIVATALGSLIVRSPKGTLPGRGKTFLGLLLGVVILSLLSLIPYVGAMIDVVVVLLAMGASVVAFFRWRRRPRPVVDTSGRPATTPPAPTPAATGAAAG